MEGPRIIGEDVLGRKIRDFASMDWWGIPRKEIEWYPRINYEKCIGCGLCFLTCSGRVVFDWDFDKRRPIVARPYNCMVGCSTCSMMCPMEAISFPSKEYLEEFKRKAQVVVKAKKKIEELEKKVKGRRTYTV